MAHSKSKIPDFRFIHISTDEVCGHLSPGDPPFTESSPVRPRSPYAASKASAEHLVRAWQTTHGLPVVILRGSNTYGTHQHGEKFIPTIIRHTLAGKPVPIYGDGRNIREWLHVEDHARAILAASTRGTAGETYNIGGGDALTNLDLVCLVGRILKEEIAARPGRLPNAPPPVTLNHIPDRPGHDFRYALDTDKARHELRWAPRSDLPTGLRQTIRNHITNPPRSPA